MKMLFCAIAITIFTNCIHVTFAGEIATHLVAAEEHVEHILKTAKNGVAGGSIYEVHLSTHHTLHFRNSQFTIGSGLHKAIPIMDDAKAELDEALKSGEKVDGPTAATFLARYAWFEASYVCANGGYPEAKFRTIIDLALKLDPKNNQALCMRAFLTYESHKKHMTDHRPGSVEWTGYIVLDYRYRKQADQWLRESLRGDPANFVAWNMLEYVNWTVNQLRKPMTVPPDIWLGLLQSANHIDMFYYAYYKGNVNDTITFAAAMLKNYPKYYEKFYGHPPPATQPATAK